MEPEPTIDTFETEWRQLVTRYPGGSFAYDKPTVAASYVIDAHFRDVQSAELHGLYIIRQRETRELIRVGKAGAITSQGRYKAQAIPGRLKNVKGATPANKWFTDLAAEYGPLLIEYVFLPPTPRSPTYVEALLLQSYLNEHACLPPKNNEL